MTNLLFVYGTLRKGAKNEKLLSDKATWMGNGVVAGTLYNLGWYPGMVLETKPRLLTESLYVLNTVYGDLYELDDVTKHETLNRLDAYEGCSYNDPEPHEYVRRKISVYTMDGEQIIAEAYVLQTVPQWAKLIENGDFLQASQR